MRNKHNEGYTLPLVMVVLLVLAIVAVTIMTTSLKNMLRQQQFIDTMKDQYVAQGEIEKIVAQLEIASAAEAESLLSSLGEKGSGSGNETSGYTVKLKYPYDTVTIACEFTVKLESSGKNTITYTSYEITKTGGGS